MWFNKSLFPLAVLITSWGLLGSSQASALGDEEAAVLFGMAVGGLAAIALNHDREHHSRHSRVVRTEVYLPRHRHSEPRRTVHQHVDHYVIIDSHHEHNYKKNYRDHGHGKGPKKAEKYRHALNYQHDSGSYYNSKHVRRHKHSY